MYVPVLKIDLLKSCVNKIFSDRIYQLGIIEILSDQILVEFFFDQTSFLSKKTIVMCLDSFWQK